MTRPVLSIEKLSFAYEHAEESVHEVSLELLPGECVVLCGASGSGKTSIIRLVNGLAGSYYKGSATGSVSFDGTNAAKLAQWQRAELVGSVFQDPSSQFFSSQLAGEVAFTCENLGYEHERVVRATDQAIRDLSLDSLRETANDSLSSGQKQKVAIASAIAPRPRIMAMDEPSSNLDEEAAESLGRMLARLKENGYAMLIAEHRLAYLMDVADRFLLVQDGRIARELSREDVLALSDQQRLSWGLRDPKGLARPMLPRPASCNEEGGGTAGRTPMRSEAAPLLELRELAASYRLGPFRSRRIFEGLSFSAASGQIIALTGENGVGKTTLARILAGLMKPKSGEVRVKGRRRRARELRKLAWYVPNDVKTEFFTPSVQEELMLLVEPDETHKDKARGLLRALGLWNMREQHPATLSGGQKQRLAIACGLMSDRPVLVLDEPTSGLDAINMELVSRTLETAAVEGRAVIVVTHDNEFLKRCCTHAYPMNPNGHAQPTASRTPA